MASYWYKEVKKYDFFKETSLLHTNVNTGHFTQMIWCGSRYFGVGKAFSKTGKMFVVAFYFPCGNIVHKFQVRLFFLFLQISRVNYSFLFFFSITFFHRHSKKMTSKIIMINRQMLFQQNLLIEYRKSITDYCKSSN